MAKTTLSALKTNMGGRDDIDPNNMYLVFDWIAVVVSPPRNEAIMRTLKGIKPAGAWRYRVYQVDSFPINNEPVVAQTHSPTQGHRILIARNQRAIVEASSGARY